jgi:hypothetical protein
LRLEPADSELSPFSDPTNFFDRPHDAKIRSGMPPGRKTPLSTQSPFWDRVNAIEIPLVTLVQKLTFAHSFPGFWEKIAKLASATILSSSPAFLFCLGSGRLTCIRHHFIFLPPSVSRVPSSPFYFIFQASSTFLQFTQLSGT